ncbi:hypothetical protein BDR05DRAFT_955224, partial [Suillus weaverae]
MSIGGPCTKKNATTFSGVGGASLAQFGIHSVSSERHSGVKKRMGVDVETMRPFKLVVPDWYQTTLEKQPPSQSLLLI